MRVERRRRCRYVRIRRLYMRARELQLGFFLSRQGAACPAAGTGKDADRQLDRHSGLSLYLTNLRVIRSSIEFIGQSNRRVIYIYG